MRLVSLILLVALLATPCASAVAATPQYTITNLGRLGPHPWGSRAEGINNAGVVVGTSYGPPPIHYLSDLYDPYHAFRYSGVGPMTDLGTLGGLGSIALGVNDSGLIVGESQYSLQVTQTDYHAFYYNGALHDMGTLGGVYSSAQAVNNSGQITGSADNASGNRHAFLYSVGGSMQDLGTLGGQTSVALDINDQGHVIGLSRLSTGFRQHAFYYDGVMHDLGVMVGGAGASTADSYATAINNLNQVAGRGTVTGGDVHAFFYDGTMHDLGTLGGDDSDAFAINDSGIVVGAADLANGNSRAFVYQNGTMYNLLSLVTNGSGWTLNYATDINSSGQIVGAGAIGNDSYAFLLTPIAVPEPATVTLFGIAGAALVGVAWRRRTVRAAA